MHSNMQDSLNDPIGSRLFVVCGRSVEEETLRINFAPFGNVQNVKLIKEKGVAYVKYDKASSAAKAMESLNGAVLNNGRGPKLKVLLAEAPTPRGVQGPPKLVVPEEQSPCDPDNVPPRSRLFLVVPKTAEARLIHDELSRYPDLEYCKTDLIASKGVVFVKYSKASSALQALEEIAAKGMLCSYKVKVMLAEPKSKRVCPELAAAAMGLFGPVGALAHHHLPPLGMEAANAMRLSSAAAGQFGAFGISGAAAANSILAAQQAAALAGGGPGAGGDYAPLQGFGGWNNATGLAAAAAAAAAAGAGGGGGMELGSQMGLGFGLGPNQLMGQFQQQQFNTPDAAGMNSSGMAGLGQQAAAAAGPGGPHGGFQSSPGNNSSMGSVSSSITNVNFPLGPFMGLSPGPHNSAMMSHMAAAAAQQQGLGGHHTHDQLAAAAAAAAAGGGPPLSQQRLFVVVHKSVSDDQLRLLFRQYPGMEYCDLKRDKASGKSKGYCYVNYSTPAAAAAAVHDLNGIEFPVGSGFRLKVMYAEIMTGSGSSSGSIVGTAAAAAALLRSSSSRSCLRTPSAGQLGSLVRAGSGPLCHQHSSSGTLGGQAGMMGPIGSQLSGQLSGPGSGPSSTGAAGITAAAGGGGGATPGPALCSRGPSPAATPLGAHSTHSVSGSELAHMADSLSSMSLPSRSGCGPTPQTMGSITSSEPSSEAVAAAAAHHFDHLQATAAAVGGSTVSSSVARELMFNVG